MVPSQKALKLRGVTQHNLKNVNVDFPLRRLVCITGVSGSGKSTLIEDVLYKALRKALGQPSEAPGAFERIEGADHIDDVVMIDQSSIGRTTRSNPASYVGAFDVVRELFANEAASKSRGYTPGTFSFNSGTGRCPTCNGNGFEHVEMQFLSDVYLRCPDCDGKRYRAETLEIRREGADGTRRTIAGVLDMTVTEALISSRTSRLSPCAAAARRRRTRVRETRAARTDVVGRRSAAPEARGTPRRSRCRRHALRPRRWNIRTRSLLFVNSCRSLN